MLPAAKEDDAHADQRPNLGLDLDWIWTGLGLSISPTIHCTGEPIFVLAIAGGAGDPSRKNNCSVNLFV